MQYEQQLWNECSRLIANCIIYYNAAILSNLLSHKEKAGESQNADLLKQVSPIAWQHINLHGRYEFSKQAENINMDDMVKRLAQIQIAEVIDTTV